MAKEAKNQRNVTRISAKGSSKRTKQAATPANKKAAKAPRTERQVARPVRIALSPFAGIGRYLKGAWVELNQVHWPTRQATWGLTLAVLLFTLFFAVLIGLLDVGFKYLFELLLG